jgi:4-hydroxybenzoate polyprenyltransferase
MGLYLARSYPPWVTLPYTFLSYACLSWSLSASRSETPSLGIGSLAGTLTTFFFLLFLRVSDEIKDAETDKRLFPDRLFPSGKILIQDLRCLWWTALAALAASVSFIWPPSPWAIGLIAYSLLMYKYFFFPKAISGNLLLALATHNPSMYILQLCALGFISPRRPPRPYDFLVCLLFYLPSLLWELSRKVRAPSRETEYQTYSSIFGFKTAAAAAFIPAGLISLLAFIMAPCLGLSSWALYAIVVALSIYAARIVVFMARPELPLPTIGKTAQAWGLAFYGIVGADMAAKIWL